MPEGPEIRRAADQLHAFISGRRVTRLVFGLDRLKHWEPRFAKTRIKKVQTRGKAILTGFDNGLTIYSHNQLYGRWYCLPAGDYPDTGRQLRLEIQAGDHSALLYSASDIEVLEDSKLSSHPFLSKMGPDVLDARTSEAGILKRLSSSRFCRRALGNLLTDQSFLAGLGNYLKCEILFYVGLHPSLRPCDLEPNQLDQLAKAILALAGQSYKTGGITRDLSTARRAMRQGGSFEAARFWVYRREGNDCYRCGTGIQRLSHGGQSCYFCPQCQLR